MCQRLCQQSLGSSNSDLYSKRPHQTAIIMQTLHIQHLQKFVVFWMYAVPREISDIEGRIWPHAVIFSNYAIQLI